MTARLVVVVVLMAAFAAAALLWRRRQRSVAAGPAQHPPVPDRITRGAERTWVLFTTPWCASCGPVEQRLRDADPSAQLVRVDATRETDLAGTFSVRSAPTVLLADRDGTVQARLVGAAAVEDYVTR